jgi:hypothetical protein
MERFYQWEFIFVSIVVYVLSKFDLVNEADCFPSSGQSAVIAPMLTPKRPRAAPESTKSKLSKFSSSSAAWASSWRSRSF